MSLDTDLVERLTECAYSRVGIFACQQVNLLEGTAIRLHSGKTAHINDYWGNALQLVLAGLEFSTRLPHVSINETELDFLLHYKYVLLKFRQRYEIIHNSWHHKVKKCDYIIHNS